MHSHVNVFHFASPTLIAGLLFTYSPLLYVTTLIPAILAPKQYSGAPKDRLKELALHIPWIGLLSAVYNPVLLAAPLLLVAVAEAAKKMNKQSELLEEVKPLDLLQYYVYTPPYLAVLQPAGAVYTAARLLRRNRTESSAPPQRRADRSCGNHQRRLPQRGIQSATDPDNAGPAHLQTFRRCTFSDLRRALLLSALYTSSNPVLLPKPPENRF